MPIDFNPQVMLAFKGNFPQRITDRKYYYAHNPNTDTFTKSVKVKTGNADKNYDGIKISQRNFGTIQKTGEKAQLYTITNKNGASVDLSNFGAAIVAIKVPDKNGKLIDVTQGYDNVTPYEMAPVGHAGGTIGPCANKISNGEFTINGETYVLEKNKDNGKSHCHGGAEGFDVKSWNAVVLPDGIEFTYVKKDMESGYPGNVTSKVTYKFDNDNNLHIIYEAQTDKDTVLNLTNHTYFNLDGEENTKENAVLNHIVQLPNSSTYTKNNEIAVPTGEIESVEGTPLDLRKPVKIGDVINSDFDQMKITSGFDQNYCIDGYDGEKLIEIANVKSFKTGVNLKVFTDLPGFQFYSANHLGKTSQPNGKSGARYEKRSSLCIEPQFYPNAINTQQFEQKPILKAGENFHKQIIYSFSVNK